MSEVQSQQKAVQVPEKEQAIVALTGFAVSDELQDILNRCQRGEYVAIEEIYTTPEVMAAESCISHQIPTIQLKDRGNIEEQVFNSLNQYGSVSIGDNGDIVVDKYGNKMYNEHVEQGNRLDIVIGLPASGKSSAIVDTISYEHHAMLIDNDEAKRLFPEFNKGWGANVVHKESQKVEQAVFRAAVKRGDNIVLPKVGSDAKKLIKNYIRYAKAYGYVVNVHFVDLDRNKALGRMLDRFVHTGRYLSPELIDKYVNPRDGNRIAKAYEELKETGLVDGFSKWDNNVERGERPILREAINLKDEFVYQAKQRGEIFYGEENQYGEFEFGSTDEFRGFSNNRADGGRNYTSFTRDLGKTGRNGGDDGTRSVSIPKRDLRKIHENVGINNIDLRALSENIVEFASQNNCYAFEKMEDVDKVLFHLQNNQIKPYVEMIERQTLKLADDMIQCLDKMDYVQYYGTVKNMELGTSLLKSFNQIRQVKNQKKVRKHGGKQL